MIYTVVGVKNYSGNFDNDIFMFHNQDEAYVAIRRNMRNLVIGDEVNADTLNETVFCCIAEFDSETGKFDNFEQPISMSAIDMVVDLLDGSNIPEMGVYDA